MEEVKIIRRDAYEAVKMSHPIEGAILEAMVADGRVKLTDE